MIVVGFGNEGGGNKDEKICDAGGGGIVTYLYKACSIVGVRGITPRSNNGKTLNDTHASKGRNVFASS